MKSVFFSLRNFSPRNSSFRDPRFVFRVWVFAICLVQVLVSASPAAAARPGVSGFGVEGLKCIHLPQLMDYFFRAHYARKSLSDSIRTNTVEQLVKNMDPSKTIFLEEDVTALKKSLSGLFPSIQRGDCRPLDSAYSLLIQRSKESEDYVRGLLGKSYSLDESAEVVIDSEKRKFPKTQAEKQSLLKGLVHFQISNYLLSGTKLQQAKEQLIHRYELVTKRLRERQVEGPVNGFAEAFAGALDPHSTYMSADHFEDFQIQMNLSLEGIGASLSSEDGFTVIDDTIPGGGAERSGLLKPKDKIIAVAQEGGKAVPVMDMDLRDVVKLIRGKKGSRVTLTILRQAEKTETFDVTITRDKIDIKDQAAKISYETRKVSDSSGTPGVMKTRKIAVIDLPSFYGGSKGGRSCSADVRQLLEEAKKEKVDGVVLNLTRNGGGLLDEAVKISGLFIQRGAVVATRDTADNTQILDDQDDSVVWKGPLVVLISRMSASASEILAGALQDYKRALVVGSDHTFGKGSVQAVVYLPPGLGAMKVTTGMFFLPGGRSTQHAGVTADVVLPPVYALDSVGEKTLDYSLPPQTIPGFLSREVNSSSPEGAWLGVDSKVVPILAAKSRERVAKDAKFAEIKKELDEAAKNGGSVKLAELRKKTAAEKLKEKMKEKSKENQSEKQLQSSGGQVELVGLAGAAKPDQKQNQKSTRRDREERIKETEAPLINEAVNILADWLLLSEPQPPRTVQISRGR
jgi:carboxyl-terminal processing protease